MTNRFSLLHFAIISSLLAGCAGDDSPFVEGGSSETNIVSSANFGVTSGDLSPDVLEFVAGTVGIADKTANCADLLYSWSPVEAEITVTAADNDGALVSSGTVYFETQYGLLSEKSCTLSDGRCSVTWESIADLSKLDSGTPSCEETGTGQIDVLNVVTAWTYGAEGFIDTDGDGELSGTETFFDTVEPFLDRNDNYVFDEGIDDTIRPNTHDAENGLYDGPECDRSTRSDCGSSSEIPIFTSVTLRLNFDSTDFSNFAPTANITAPADGADITAGGSVTFTVDANDAEDGTSLSVSWDSDQTVPGAGFLSAATGPIDTTGWDIGTHTITVTVTDSDSNSVTDTITVTR